MSYFSRYPEAILLKKWMMLEVFSSMGLSSEIQLTRVPYSWELMKQICKVLNIHPIGTSTYLPETDGLQRWHAYLIAMLKKAASDKEIWTCTSPMFCLHTGRRLTP